MIPENGTALDSRSKAAPKPECSDHHPTRLTDEWELDRELASLTTAAAGRCRRRGEVRKARWFHRQSDLAKARLRA